MTSIKIMNIEMSLKKIICFAVCCILLYPVLGSNVSQHRIPLKEDIQGWKTVREDKSDPPSWMISARNITGTNFLEYKIEGDIQSTAKACHTAFRLDLHKLADNPEDRKYPTYEILEESEEGLLTYVVHNEPFPFKDTEMSVRYLFFTEEDGSTGVRWQEAWDESSIQPSKKLNRVETFRGSLHCTPTSNNSCHAVKSVQFDPKKMPLWLIEPMVFNFLRAGLEDLRAMTLENNDSISQHK
ncbi:MAG: hypothetical protein RIC80_02955 [Cyclobacteriaceae bacterium]